MEIWHAIKEGAPFSFINLFVLCFGIAIIVERTWYIRLNYSVDAPEFMNRIRKLVQAGNIDRAIRQCEAKAIPLLEVVKSGLTQVNRGEEAVIASMEEKMSEVMPALERRTGSLWTLANIATLIGLLGTINGLITAFKAVGTIDDPSKKTAMLSAGIAEAMWNTFLGLLIAVIFMTAHLVLHSSTKRHKHEMEKVTMQLENLLTLKRQGG